MRPTEERETGFYLIICITFLQFLELEATGMWGREEIKRNSHINYQAIRENSTWSPYIWKTQKKKMILINELLRKSTFPSAQISEASEYCKISLPVRHKLYYSINSGVFPSSRHHPKLLWGVFLIKTMEKWDERWKKTWHGIQGRFLGLFKAKDIILCLSTDR